MEAIDPFYNPEEEKRAKEQSSRNSVTRNLLRSRQSGPDSVPEGHGESPEFIKMEEASTHSSEQNHASVSGKVPWMPTHGYPPYKNFYLRLHQEILDFTRWISLTDSEQRSRETFIHRLNGVCKSIWPKSKVVSFGSFLTGLSLPSSDVDVSVINVPTDEHELYEVGCLRRLANALLEQQQVSFVELRESAKVPILRVRDREAPHCEIDINMNIEAPQATSKFVIRNAIEVYPQFRPLTLLIKCFLAQRSLADTFTGGIGSYLLSCLVLGFLQQHQITTQPRMNELTSLGHLLFDFFNFYAKDFRVDRDGLSVRRGGSRFLKSTRQFEFTRASVTNRRSLPPSDSLCVESPLEPELDIGNKVFQWKVIRSALMQARQVMVDEIQKYDPMNAMKSFLAPALVSPVNPLFVRWTGENDKETPACPLSIPGVDVVFRGRSESLPPSPYSDSQIDLDTVEDEEPVYEDKRQRRYSDDPRGGPYRDHHESSSHRRESTGGHGRRDDREYSDYRGGHGDHHKRSRYN